jgi:hypothetical protein
MSREELHSLYGEMANKSVTAIRSICRARLTGHHNIYTVEVLTKQTRDCRTLAKSIDALGGSERAMQRCEKIANIHEYYQDKPGKIHGLVNEQYRVMYKEIEENVSTTDFNDERLMCPYEESGSKKACWTCHLPARVWAAMERNYEKDTFGNNYE